MIHDLDLPKLKAREPAEMARLVRAVREVGFLTVSDTGFPPGEHLTRRCNETCVHLQDKS
ncbi:hypothetical protein FGK63_06925 [Ruegeria sediminis]|uniref:Uncharacterized protein n=1 Tax=Ruegeria sediminis TaxID=2583820 RepID=A0ABY2X0S7_9RHOB|nr:hypothetical protein [Ruegeria sediminis]TMV08846.1 hypothetical protein FGK63_06925 [Ruegeria sediminis]